MESSALHCVAQVATGDAKDASDGTLLDSQMHARSPAKRSFGDSLMCFKEAHL